MAELTKHQVRTPFVIELQNVVQDLGLAQDKSLMQLDPTGMTFRNLAVEMAARLRIPIDEAMEKLHEWQTQQKLSLEELEKQEEEVELAKKQKRKARVPIWRCGVCGRADKPYIACFVAPFVLRYDWIDV